MSDPKKPSARTIRTKLRKAKAVGPGCKSRGRKRPTSRARKLQAQKRAQAWRRWLAPQIKQFRSPTPSERAASRVVAEVDRTARESCRTRRRLKPRRQREERAQAWREGTGPDY